MRDREDARAEERQRGRERERERERMPSQLHAVSMKAYIGLEPMNGDIMT